MCIKTQMIEECGKHMHGTLPLRDDIITTAVDCTTETISSESIVHSTREIAQMTTSVRELSAVFRKMVEDNTDKGENTGV